MTDTATDDIAEAEIVDEHHLPARQNPGTAMTLFGTSNPAEALQRAIDIATPLAQLIKDRGLSKNLGGDKDHVQIEGWQTLGGMLGLSVDTAWTRKVTDPDGEWAPPVWHLEQQERPSKFKQGTYMADVKVIDTPGKGGWEARVEVRRPDGSQAGTGEMECRWDERNWRDNDSYALRSMAQTRAASKAYRQALGFVMVLAGFSATPAEEMDGVAVKPHRTNPAGDEAEHQCPSCGAGLYDQRAEHEANPKKPAWKCSNRDCQGGNPKDKDKPDGPRWGWASWDTEPPLPPDHPLARLQDLVAVNYTDGDLNMADRVIDEACGNLGLIRDTIDDAPTLNKVWAACFDVAAGWGLPGAAPEAVDDDSGRPFEEVPDEG